MKTTIVIGDEHQFSVLKMSEKNRYFFYTLSEPEAHLYHIEHPEVDSYIVISKQFTKKSMTSLIQHIHYLNSIISIIILPRDLLSEELEENRNIIICKKFNELPEILKNLPKTHRNTNRVEWPVKVVFRGQETEGKRFLGNILSISSGGCFIRTSESMGQNTLLTMTIKFQEFDLFTEGKIVRHSGGSTYQPEGLAVQFLRTSPQTKICIQRIIDEKILGELMQKLNPEQIRD